MRWPYRVDVTRIRRPHDADAPDLAELATAPGGAIPAAGLSPGGARVPQPRALIVTVYGLYARDVGGWLSVATLIRLMVEIGVDEPAVRSAISRLKRRGMVEPVRRDSLAGYALSSAGREMLDEGDERIFHRQPASLDDGWLLAVFSVPESERQRRHTLRSRLAWLGFGAAAPGVWVAPAHLYPTTQATLRRHQLDQYVNLFRADYLAFGDLSESIRQWWDLEELQRLYGEFSNTYRPVLRKWSSRELSDPEPAADSSPGAEPGPAPSGAPPSHAGWHGAEAFADWVRALTAWRRLPYLDPGLPAELLPADWNGARAADLFHELQRRLSAPARAYVRSATG